MNSCNSNSCSSKYYLNRTNSSAHSEFTSKPLQENSFNSNSHNSKNRLNRTNFWVPWTYFLSCNSNFAFGVYFFQPLIFCCSKVKCFNSNDIIFECFEIFKFLLIPLLVADATKMATKRKLHEVALKVKCEALKELEKGRRNKGVTNQFGISGSTFATWKKNKEQIFKALQNSSLKRRWVKTGTYNEALFLTTFQSMVLFFWRKLMSLLRLSITTILQYRTDGFSNGCSSLACTILYIIKKHPLHIFFKIGPK